MTHMPKHMTKGDYFTHLDQRHSPPAANAADRTERARVLDELRQGLDIANVGSVGTVGGLGGQNHLRADWFGLPIQPTGQTGWWRNWRGEPEKVLRCGLIRALEVSMGLAHKCPEHVSSGSSPQKEDPAQFGARNLPIDYYWVCGPSRFEVYVSWNRRQVTVILVTPGFPFALAEFNSEDTGPALDNWAISEDVGTIFVGQHEKVDAPDEDEDYDFATMEPEIVTHHLSDVIGGSGPRWPSDP